MRFLGAPLRAFIAECVMSLIDELPPFLYLGAFYAGCSQIFLGPGEFRFSDLEAGPDHA